MFKICSPQKLWFCGQENKQHLPTGNVRLRCHLFFFCINLEDIKSTFWIILGGEPFIQVGKITMLMNNYKIKESNNIWHF